MRTLFTIAITWLALIAGAGQSFSDQTTYTVETGQLKRLRLHNLYGPVTVRAVSGRAATIKVSRKMSASSAAMLEEAKGKIFLDSTFLDGELLFFVQAPDRRLEMGDDGSVYYNSCCDDSWSKSGLRASRVKYEMTIEMEVPAQTDLYVSTHEEKLTVSSMNSNVIAGNHHDDVLLENIGGNASVRTHHGDIEVYYTRNPVAECSYQTHHGDIRIHYQKPLSADVSMSSRHGEFFTAFDWSPRPMEIVENTDDSGARYIVNKGTAVRIGSGGAAQYFDTYHGDIFLLDQ